MARKRTPAEIAPIAADQTRSFSRKKQCELLVLEVIHNSNGDGTPKQSDVDFQKDVFNRLRASRLQPKWITADECMRKDKRGSEVFVLLYFAGIVFEHLSSLNCRIYGTVATLTCMMNGERLPKWTHPILSMTLNNCVVCFTGIDHDIRDSKTDWIMQMNGTVSKDFNCDVTHLVAKDCDPSSQKYVAAVKSGIPVLSMEWIGKAWDAALRGYTTWFGDEDIYSEYRLKIFTDCVITCSGLSSAERMTISQIVKVNGGVFTPEMERNRCTHLLTDKNSGEKYRKARQWGWDCVKIVRVKWLDKCIEKGMRLEERLYEPKFSAKAKTSTPQNDSVPAASFDVSCVSGPLQATIKSRSDCTLSPLSASSNPHTRLNKAVTDVADSSSTSADSSLLRRRVSMRPNCSSHSTKEMTVPDPIEAIGLTANDAYDYLENCRLFLCGFKEEEIQKWKQVVNALGATRLPGIYSDLTHIIVGTQEVSGQLLEKVKEVSSAVSVVTYKWLIECGKQQKMVNEMEFIHPLFYEDATQNKQSSRQSNRQCSRIRPIVSTSMNDVLSKIPSGNTERYDVNCPQRVNHPVTKQKEVIKHEDKELSDAIDKERLCKQHEEQNMERLFAGLSFGIDSIDDTLAEDLKTTVMELGGKCESDAGIHLDYLLLPLLHYGSLNEIIGRDAGNVVSAFWMQDCIEKGRLVDPNAHPLYRPMKASLESHIFEGCIIALSSMERLEKEAYTELLKTFGAIVQNQLVKRGAAGGMLQRNTHVVACDEGERTACARKWRIPVVDPSWIIESIIKNENQKDEDFRFDEKPLKNYVRNDELWLALCHSLDRRSSELSQRESMSPGAAPLCTTARSSSDDCVIIEDGSCKNRMTREDERKCEEDEVCIIEAPVSSRLKALRKDNLSINTSPLIDTPSKFLDPNTNFIPRFDLRDAYAVVDAMHSCRTSSLSTEGVNWSESMVGRVLEEAASKTAATYTDPIPRSTEVAHVASSMKTLSSNSKKEAHVSTESENCGSKKGDANSSERIEKKKVGNGRRESVSSSSLQKILRRGAPSQEQKSGESHKNFAKQRLLEEKLANLAAKYGHSGGATSLQSIKDMKSEHNSKRKRRIAESQVDRVEGTSSKRIAQMPLTENAIGWEEAPIPCSEDVVDERVVTVSPCSIRSLTKKVSARITRRDSHHEDEQMLPSSSKKARQLESTSEKSESRQTSVVTDAVKDISKTNTYASSKQNTNNSKKRCIVFSGVTIEERERLGGLAKRLGSEVRSEFVDDVTHLCCGVIIRNVKLMRAIGAGKYVVQPDYIERSHSAGRWLEEGEYEWGSDTNTTKHTFESVRQEKLAAACHRWRVKVEETSRKAFDGWCVLFYCSQRRLPDLAKIVECGGGTWHLRDEITMNSDIVSTFTLALVERSSYWTESEIDMLIERGVCCYPLDYRAVTPSIISRRISWKRIYIRKSSCIKTTPLVCKQRRLLKNHCL
uniref:DNA topoisomerase 2-binding protein 1 n=1 Tax=Ascaris suum TaxID=6253 RepID=F1KQE3_ASCSU